MLKHKINKTSTMRGGAALWALLGLSILLILAALASLFMLHQFSRDLPPVDQLRELTLSEPMRVYSSEGALIGEFGTERRIVVAHRNIPDTVIHAFLAAEDERFLSHGGVDITGLLRAVIRLVQTGEKAQGGSTITMQVARNVFLSSEKTYTRKLREILLARQIEQELSKSEILELYLNKIFLGERAYGVAAAAQVYFNKSLEELTLAEAAVLAGLPKAPSRDNPIANPQRSLDRRGYVLRRMLAAGFIDQAAYETAREEPLVVEPYRPSFEVDAHYVAEMARAEMVQRFGDAAYTQGLRVYTTLRAPEQAAAVQAVRNALHAYEERQGWRGPEQQWTDGLNEPVERQLRRLAGLPRLPELMPALVTASEGASVTVLAADGSTLSLSGDTLDWAKLDATRRLAPGDVIRLRPAGKDGWRLAQLPRAQAALVSLNPDTGDTLSMVGGYDFFASKFNRASQGQRQVGSAFKPFLYAAALDYGFTPASVLLDAPVVFDDPALESSWRPQNYTGRFYGPTRLREALVQSRNLVSIRLLQDIGIDRGRNYVARFGLARDRLPRDLTLSLGSAAFTPQEVALAYARFANGGHTVSPRLVTHVEAADGTVLWTAEPPFVPCSDEGCPEVAEPELDPAVLWLVSDMLRDVTRRGTAAQVRQQLNRSDLSGKTGTTNDETDAWFAGYNAARVAVAWVGHDQPQPLGRGEVGGRAALPIWIDYMRVALKEVPETLPPPPAGVVSVRIDPRTGALATSATPDARFEFIQSRVVLEEEGSERPARSLPEADRTDLDDLF